MGLPVAEILSLPPGLLKRLVVGSILLLGALGYRHEQKLTQLEEMPAKVDAIYRGQLEFQRQFYQAWGDQKRADAATKALNTLPSPPPPVIP